MNALGQGLAPLAAEFAGNARLRWGVWLMLGIALFYCILVQSDRVAVVHDDYVAETEHMVKAETILRDRQDWPQLLEAERETYRERVAGFWQAETTGLAQAKLQAALADVIDGFDLRKPRIRSGGSQPVPGFARGLACAGPTGRRLSAGDRAAGSPRAGDVSEKADRRSFGSSPPGRAGFSRGTDPVGLFRRCRSGAEGVRFCRRPPRMIRAGRCGTVPQEPRRLTGRWRARTTRAALGRKH